MSVILAFTLRRRADPYRVRKLTLGLNAVVGEIWPHKGTRGWTGYNMLSSRFVDAEALRECRDLLERDIIETLRTSRIWPYED